MIANSLLVQVAMLILSGAVFLSFIKPTFMSIGKLQDEKVVYEEEKEKVNEVKSKLQNLISEVSAISYDDQLALTTYMPEEIDQVKITSDIYAIGNKARAFIRAAQYEGFAEGDRSGLKSNNGEDTPVRHEFNVDLTGTYGQIKQFLAFLEQNNYPLEVHNMKITTTELGILGVQLKLVTYSHK